jgi:cell division protein FtsB
VYERRAPGIPASTSQTNENASREQQLEAEVADLRYGALPYISGSTG